jgi:hypothetical protein
MESYNRFRTEQFQWFRIAENSYDNFAFSGRPDGALSNQGGIPARVPPDHPRAEPP